MPLCPARVELEREGVDPAAELVHPALELPRLASEVVEARPQACHASLELGQRLGRPPVGCLDLGQERGPARLDLLLDPAEISPEPVQILAEEVASERTRRRG